jgi:hypothetical protein
MIEPEFPEDNLAYDSAGNCLGAPPKNPTWTHDAGAAVIEIARRKAENRAHDIKVIQHDRANTMAGLLRLER